MTRSFSDVFTCSPHNRLSAHFSTVSDERQHPPAIRTVRLREAARLSEEQLGDLDGAIHCWKLILESDPKVRDATRALQRLFEQTGKAEELAALLESEENRKNKSILGRLSKLWGRGE